MTHCSANNYNAILSTYGHFKYSYDIRIRLCLGRHYDFDRIIYRARYVFISKFTKKLYKVM